MFSEEEMRYRMQIQIEATKDEMVRRLANEVGHLLLPFERLMEADVRQRVDAALAPPAA